MLAGSHEKTNASTKAGAPVANASEDWFDIAYMLHKNRASQSGTSNYGSRMEAMRYSTIAEYNNTNHSYVSSITNNGKIIKQRSVCNDSQFVKTIARPTTYTVTKNTYTGKTVKPTITITDSNGKKLLSSSYKVT